MGINLFGNLSNFSYRPTEVNLFEAAKKQDNHPVRFCDTEAGKNMPAIKLSISEEGLRALHGSKLQGSTDIKAEQEQIKFYSEHQPIDSFQNQLTKGMQECLAHIKAENPNKSITISDKENVLMNCFKSIADEIIAGYNDDTRVRFARDSKSEDGYSKLSKTDELMLLKQEFEDFVESRFGEKHQKEAEEVAKTLNSFQSVKAQMGSSDIRTYTPEKIPKDFVEILQKNAGQYISDAFKDDASKTLSITSSGVKQLDRAEQEELIAKSTIQLEGAYKKFNLTDSEACILKSFRLEEYYDIRGRMKNEDKDAYNNLLKEEEEANKTSDPSAKFKVYAKAYNWAYGDIFDKIHKENPDVDIYVKSSGTPESHNYQMRNNRTSIVLSTDEIKLLQSKKETDKDAQEKLWNSILERIKSK